jgi:hypothetical protein
MIRSILLFAFLLFGVVASAQKIRFTDSTNVWFEKGSGRCGSGGTFYGTSTRYYYTGDTLINGLEYRKLMSLYCHTPSFGSTSCTTTLAGCVREDITGKVFIYGFKGNGTDSLMLDYNMQVGDTLITSANWRRKILALDSVKINNVFHKVWKIEYVDLSGQLKDETFHVVEGVGPTFGVLHIAEGAANFYESSICYYYNHLYCVKNGGMIPAVSKKIDQWDSQNSCTLGVDDARSAVGRNVTVVPHPANATGYIGLPYQLTGRITILNQLGQVVRSERIENKDRWMLEGKIPSPGLYIYHISDEASGEQMSGKLIYQ